MVNPAVDQKVGSRRCSGIVDGDKTSQLRDFPKIAIRLGLCLQGYALDRSPCSSPAEASRNAPCRSGLGSGVFHEPAADGVGAEDSREMGRDEGLQVEDGRRSSATLARANPTN